MAMDGNQQREFEDIIFSYRSHGPGTDAYRVKFLAFVTNFQDNFTQAWNSTEVYGKPDGIETYQNTSRIINLAWTVPSNGPAEGYGNMVKIDALMRMLYPVYEKQAEDVSTINRPPLLGLKFANLIHNGRGGALLGHVSGFTFAPDMGQGMYNTRDSKQYGPERFFGGAANFTSGTPFKEDTGLIPKSYSMSCQFKVLHDQDLGFSNASKNFSQKSFPYGFMESEAQLKTVNKFSPSQFGKSVSQTGAPSAIAQEAEIAKLLGGN